MGSARVRSHRGSDDVAKLQALVRAQRADVTEVKAFQIEMTRDQAQELSQALNDARRSLVSRIATIKRIRKSWRPSEKAMAIAEYQQHLDTLIRFHDNLQRAYGIGGY